MSALTVIAAETLHDAREAAFNLGLEPTQWVYPDAAYKLRGVLIERVVYVDGWRQSAAVSADAMRELQCRRIAQRAIEIEQPTTDGVLLGIVRADLARHELDRQRRLARLGAEPSPFIDPDAPTAKLPRPSLWVRLEARYFPGRALKRAGCAAVSGFAQGLREGNARRG